MTHGGPRKGAGRPSADPKRANLNIRLSESRLTAYREAAARAGLDVTAWAERSLDRAATK